MKAEACAVMEGAWNGLGGKSSSSSIRQNQTHLQIEVISAVAQRVEVVQAVIEDSSSNVAMMR